MKPWRFLLTLVCCAGITPLAVAHEVRPAYLELRKTAEDTYDVLWKVPALSGAVRLGIYVRFPPEAKELGAPHGMFTGDAYVERRRVQVAGALDGKTVQIDGLAATKIDVLVRVVGANGVSQTVRVLPASPSFTVEATPSRWKVSATYLALGIEHILLGIDHLLFVLALMLVVKGGQRLVSTITAFTVAHSLTLALATLGVVQVPGEPVEASIALSIVFVAGEIIRSREGKPGLTERTPWLIAFAFGLLHGLGFASALSQVGLPQESIPLALLFFNVGVELGQLAFVGIVLGLAAAARRIPVRTPTWGWRVVPYAIGAVAMFWVIQRASAF